MFKKDCKRFFVGIILIFIVFLAACNKDASNKVYFESNNEILIEPLNKNDEGIYSLPILKKEGYTFQGWYYDDDSFKNEVTPDNLSSNLNENSLTIYARWQANSYNISFETNGGTEVHMKSYVTDQEIKTLPVAYRIGYSFDGWYIDEDLTIKFDNKVMPPKDLKLYAKWLINQYKITFYGLNNEVIKEISYNYNEDIKDLNIDGNIYKGYTLIEWLYDIPEKMPAYNIDIKGSYEVQKFAVVFKDYDGSILSFEIVEYAQSATAPLVPYIREGYTFKSWNADFSFIDKDITVTALYEINTYEVTFLDYDDKVLKVDRVTYLHAASSPSNPQNKLGYHFNKWSEDFNEVKGNIVIRAIYEINQYEVTFIDNDGSIISKEIVNHGEAVIAPEFENTYNGYDFVGWNHPLINITSNITVVARYGILNTITYDTDGGDYIESDKVEKGTFKKSPVPTKSGYNFIGWSYDDKLVDLDLLVETDIELVAKWEVTVKYYKYADYVSVTGINNIIGRNLIIPEYIEGLPVKNISNYAFSNSQIDTVFIPKSIEKIGYMAFANSEVKTVIFEEGSLLKSFGQQIFYQTNNLETIELPENLESFETGFDLNLVSYISVHPNNKNFYAIDGVLYNYDQTILIKYPERMDYKEEFILPNTVVDMKSNALTNAHIKTLYIGENLEDFKAQNISKIYNIIIDENNPYLVTVNGIMFSKDLTRLIKSPHIQNEHIIIPATVERIESNAFYEIKSVLYVGFEENSVLEEIGESAFAHTAIKEITIPASTKIIHSTAFHNTYLLNKFTIEENSQLEIIEHNAFNNTALTYFIIPKNVKSLKENIFYNSKVKELEFEEGISLELINEYTFAMMKSIERISLPTGINYIGENAFYGNTTLEYVFIPKTVTYIATKAFYETGLYSKNQLIIEFEEDSQLETIESSAFQTSSLQEINLGKHVKNIENAFLYANKLEKITVDEGNEYYKSIDGVLFNKDASILIAYPSAKKDILYILNEEVVKIESFAFSYNIYIENIVICNKDIEIFSNFDGMEYIKIYTYNDDFYKYWYFSRELEIYYVNQWTFDDMNPLPIS